MLSTLPWWCYSAIAVVIWGFQMNMISNVSKVLPAGDPIMSALAIYWLPVIPLVLLLPFYYEKLWSNLHILMTSGTSIQVQTILLTFLSILATCALYMSLAIGKNPTLGALLSIPYPLTVALVAWLVFNGNPIDWSVIVGGLMIFGGAILIIWVHG